MLLLPGLEGAPSVNHSNCQPEKADRRSKNFQNARNYAAKNLDTEQSFPYAQHTALTAANKSDCCAEFSVC